MVLDIAESIREILSERRSVSMDGIGTIKMVHRPASFSIHKDKLLPPSKHIFISDRVESNTGIIDYLSKKYKIRTAKAEQAIKLFSRKILNAFINYGKVHIDGIGTITKDDEGKTVIDIKDSYISNYYKGYPELDIRPIPRIKEKILVTEAIPVKEAATPVSASISSSKEKPKEEKKKIIAAQKKEVVKPISTAPLKTETPKIESQTSINDRYKVKTEELKPTIEPVYKKPVEKASYSELAPAKSVSTYQDQPKSYDKTTYHTTYQEESGRRGWWWPLLGILLLFGLLFLLFKGCSALYDNYYKSSGVVVDTTAQNITTEDGVIADGNEGALGDSTSNERVLLMIDDLGEEIYLPESGNCIIITGSFTKIGNAIRMRELLDGLGYDTYTETYGRLTRVGLEFDCRDKDLRSYITNIRREIEKQSWYLDPEAHIDYE